MIQSIDDFTLTAKSQKIIVRHIHSAHSEPQTKAKTDQVFVLERHQMHFSAVIKRSKTRGNSDEKYYFWPKRSKNKKEILTKGRFWPEMHLMVWQQALEQTWWSLGWRATWAPGRTVNYWTSIQNSRPVWHRLQLCLHSVFALTLNVFAEFWYYRKNTALPMVDKTRSYIVLSAEFLAGIRRENRLRILKNLIKVLRI